MTLCQEQFSQTLISFDFINSVKILHKYKTKNIEIHI
jgi:hypothetical protein